MILVIGPLKLTGGGGPAILRQQGYRFAEFEDLEAGLLLDAMPDMVVSPLIGQDFDAMDVARRLAQLGYRGPYRALTAPLPRPGLVKAEVMADAPGLDFDLVVVSHEPDRPG